MSSTTGIDEKTNSRKNAHRDQAQSDKAARTRNYLTNSDGGSYARLRYDKDSGKYIRDEIADIIDCMIMGKTNREFDATTD